MSRSLRSFLPVSGDADAVAAAFSGDPLRWLPNARRDGPERWLIPLRAGSFTRTVSARLGHPWRAGATRWRTLSWDPTGEAGDGAALERLLPSLDGELGLHLETGGRVTLVIDARYRPPGGPLGVAADAMAMRRIALTTVERFLEDVAARLAAEALLISDDALPARPRPRPVTTPSVRSHGHVPDEHGAPSALS